MTTNFDNKESVQNLEKCSRFDSCSRNFCPLDYGLEERYGKKQDKCRYMREPKRAMIGGRKFVSGGAIMPNVPLKFVLQRNLKWLNGASKRHWQEITGLDEFQRI